MPFFNTLIKTQLAVSDFTPHELYENIVRKSQEMLPCSGDKVVTANPPTNSAENLLITVEAEQQQVYQLYEIVRNCTEQDYLLLTAGRTVE